ncbi:hypothetical protein AVEN_188953-1 [Araneus ventricosus]|uniref:Uncharacterized protein n=1 Tax=Araneus ventricosus TaxID=182803 RepID=A0A4Y1ZJI3_ARAVE|nr:hypothetical protein AVEN_188953-1 [Araneus ventricosus]
MVTYKNAFEFKDDVFHSSLCSSIPGECRQEFAQEVFLCAEMNRFKNDPSAYLEIGYNTLWIHAGKTMPFKKRPYPN